jgi:hypothetical protein
MVYSLWFKIDMGFLYNTVGFCVRIAFFVSSNQQNEIKWPISKY